jgi:hypothetical protein
VTVKPGPDATGGVHRGPALLVAGAFFMEILMSTLQELGAGLGVAVGALLVRLGEPVARTVGLGSGADQPFRVAFVLLAVVLLEPLAQGLRLSRAAGNEVTGRA